MAFQKKLPTSAKGVVGFAKGSARTGTFALMVLLGLGLLAFALPLLKRVPVLGGILSSGQAMVPGQSQQMTVDQWGRVL